MELKNKVATENNFKGLDKCDIVELEWSDDFTDALDKIPNRDERDIIAAVFEKLRKKGELHTRILQAFADIERGANSVFAAEDEEIKYLLDCVISMSGGIGNGVAEVESAAKIARRDFHNFYHDTIETMKEGKSLDN